jgi:two-component system, OmpR family, response regulator
MAGPRILVVDDEPNITELVTMALRYEGFEVAAAATGRSALSTVEEFRPDLVILDVMLPDLDGFEVARLLGRDGVKVPVLFLTARDAVEDKVRGLTLAGGDYVTKPFSIEELVARVRVLLRRSSSDAERAGPLEFADLSLDDDIHEVRRGGVAVELTATEFRLLRYLMQNAPRVLSKAQILDHVWNYDFGGDTSNVETYISYLRKKVDALGPPLIQTVRGVGYRLASPRGASPAEPKG